LLVCAADFLLWATITSRSRLARAHCCCRRGARDLGVHAPRAPPRASQGRRSHRGDRGQPYAYRDVTEYYTTINVERARERAQLAVATLAGLAAIGSATPPGARVMWMRPEYVGLLGHRPGVPFYFRWGAPEVAAEVKRAGVDYVVDTWLLKTISRARKATPTSTPHPTRGPLSSWANTSC
jgi:hypothetical protein